MSNGTATEQPDPPPGLYLPTSTSHDNSPLNPCLDRHLRVDRRRTRNQHGELLHRLKK